MNAFPMVEKAVRHVIESSYQPAADSTGGDPSPEGELYVQITLVSGQTDEVNGQWILDIDCFSPSYGQAMNHSLALEPVLLGRRHVTPTMRLDNVYQNESPTERPWDDDGVSKVGATYVFTARRSG